MYVGGPKNLGTLGALNTIIDVKRVNTAQTKSMTLVSLLLCLYVLSSQRLDAFGVSELVLH